MSDSGRSSSRSASQSTSPLQALQRKFSFIPRVAVSARSTPSKVCGWWTVDGCLYFCFDDWGMFYPLLCVYDCMSSVHLNEDKSCVGLELCVCFFNIHCVRWCLLMKLTNLLMNSVVTQFLSDTRLSICGLHCFEG